MAQAGLGVMIDMLTGGTKLSAEQFDAVTSKMIKHVCINADDKLAIRFEDRSHLLIWDAGQLCCEHRYMTCDDDLASIVDVMLIGYEVESAPDVEDEYGECHEQQFLKMMFSDGTGITVVTHNEHNGYYGGFSLAAEYEEAH